jgi:hypothetical protein
MDASDDHGRIGLDPIEHGIRESAHKSPAHAMVDNRKGVRQAFNSREDRFHRSQEL